MNSQRELESQLDDAQCHFQRAIDEIWHWIRRAMQRFWRSWGESEARLNDLERRVAFLEEGEETLIVLEREMQEEQHRIIDDQENIFDRLRRLEERTV